MADKAEYGKRLLAALAKREAFDIETFPGKNGWCESRTFNPELALRALAKEVAAILHEMHDAHAAELDGLRARIRSLESGHAALP